MPKASRDAAGELVHVERGGVDDQVGLAAQVGQHDPLALRARRAAGRCPAAGAGGGRPPGGARARRRWPRGRPAWRGDRWPSGPGSPAGTRRTSPSARRRRPRSAARRPGSRRRDAPRRAAGWAAGCRRRSSRGPRAPWRRCCARRRSSRSPPPAVRWRGCCCSLMLPRSLPWRCSPKRSPEQSARPRRSGATARLDRGGGAGPDAGHLGDLLGGGRPQLLQRAEVT